MKTDASPAAPAKTTRSSARPKAAAATPAAAPAEPKPKAVEAKPKATAKPSVATPAIKADVVIVSRHRIAECAYFLWQNQTGKNWEDSVSNWLEAEQLESKIG